MRFDLSEVGYDLTQRAQVGFAIGVYDVDGFFPFADATFSSKRAWWQNSFGNFLATGEGRIFVDPAVTVGTTLPQMPYDFVVAQGGSTEMPTIDGSLDESVWDRLEGTEIRLVTSDEDTEGLAVRAGYPGIGPFVSGQFVADVDGDATNTPPTAIDPARATVKWFYRGTTLYVGVDVQDAAISSGDGEDRWDGFRVGLNDRTVLEPNDNYLLPRDLAVRLDESGALVAERDLAGLIATDADAAQFAASVDGTVNNPSDSDTGYQIEMAIDLTALGYPADLGDRNLFIGASLSDFDMLDDPSASYGSRTWLFRERANAVAAYAYLDPSNPVANEGTPEASDGIALRGGPAQPVRHRDHAALPAARGRDRDHRGVRPVGPPGGDRRGGRPGRRRQHGRPPGEPAVGRLPVAREPGWHVGPAAERGRPVHGRPLASVRRAWVAGDGSARPRLDGSSEMRQD